MPEEGPGPDPEPQPSQRSDAPASEPLHELTLGQPRTPPPAAKPPRGSPAAWDDLGLEPLADRCRARAEAARWAAERQRRLRERAADPEDEAPADPALRQWADRLTDAFYWASAEEASGAGEITRLDDVAGCFEALGEALRLVHAARQRRGALEKALSLLAEAQSAVRRSLQRLHAAEDPDQVAAYEIVCELTARHRVFLRRFLRADDLAEPEGWPDLLARVEAEAGAGRPPRQHELALDRLRSQARLLSENGGEEETWRTVIEAVEAALREGLPPSSPQIREVLLPHVETLPERGDLPQGFLRVLREVDRYLATRPEPAASPPSQAAIPEVAQAARLLSGRSAVLIGGLRRPQAQQALRAALGLREVVWISTREHQSIQGFEPMIAWPEVAVVLLAIRWSSHAFGDVKRFCDRYGKPLVRLPGGYGPNQVAHHILAQCGERLEGR